MQLCFWMYLISCVIFPKAVASDDSFTVYEHAATQCWTPTQIYLSVQSIWSVPVDPAIRLESPWSVFSFSNDIQACLVPNFVSYIWTASVKRNRFKVNIKCIFLINYEEIMMYNVKLNVHVCVSSYNFPTNLTNIYINAQMYSWPLLMFMHTFERHTE
jgi:hypothetical protein